MPLYEHVFIARQDLSPAQAEGLMDEFQTVIAEGEGTVVGREYWGLKSMAYKINKNRKGHYAFFRLDCDPTALQEMERRQRLHEDILRIMSIKVDGHEEGPSAVMLARNQRDSRGGRDRGPRDRDRDRGPRDRDRGPREDRPRREETASE